jgi:hypothetical protein
LPDQASTHAGVQVEVSRIRAADPALMLPRRRAIAHLLDEEGRRPFVVQ